MKKKIRYAIQATDTSRDGELEFLYHCQGYWSPHYKMTEAELIDRREDAEQEFTDRSFSLIRLIIETIK